jgi:hypothetical protein
MFLRMGLTAAVLAGATGAAQAQQTEVLFSRKHWQVEVVGWDDGRLGCVAQVSAPGESFSLWTFPDDSVQLQFFSSTWEFGEGTTADLQLQIDRRPQWSLTNAELYKNSVLFNLPDGDAGVNFIVEVAQGSRLYLRDDSGEGVKDYSLSGSRASIDALVECGKVISDQSPSNPFD